MCRKSILTLAIIATVSVQFGHSLFCNTCFDLGTCKYYTKTYCDPISAEATLRSVELFYADAKYINPKYNNEYECFVGRYGSNNKPIGDLRGCIAKGAIDCVKNKEEHGRELCTLCNTEFCNSVATISSSVFITLGLFVLSKVF